MKRWFISLALLLSLGAQGEAYDDMIQAVKNDFASDAETLLQRGFDVNGTDPKGNSFLMLAVWNGATLTFPVLMRFHPRLTQRNVYGETALMLAAYKRQTVMVSALLQAGAPVNHEGWSPLHYAASGGAPEIVAQLIAKGANVNAQAPDGSTPLIMAAREGQSEALQQLLTARADPNVENRAGMTALRWAGRRQDTDNADLLRRYRAYR